MKLPFRKVKKNKEVLDFYDGMFDPDMTEYKPVEF